MSAVDDDLIHAMLGQDRALADFARKIFDRRHANDPKISEAAHCSECFEGCARCQPQTITAEDERLFSSLENA